MTSFRFHGRSKTRHSQQQVSDICLSVRTVADNVGNPASAWLFHSETSRVDPNIVRLCMDASMAALAFRLLQALISRIFNATDYQKKGQFPIQISQSIIAFTPKKPALLPRW